MLITRPEYCATTLVPVAAEQRDLGDVGSAEPAKGSAPLRIVVAKPGWTVTIGAPRLWPPCAMPAWR